MKAPETRGGWKAATLVALATLALPFALTACLWRRFEAGQISHLDAPTLFQIQMWALLPFLVLAGVNAGFIYAPWTRAQRWSRLLAGTFGQVLAFASVEFLAFRRVFDAASVPKNAPRLFGEAIAAGVAGLVLLFVACYLIDLLVQWIRSRRGEETAHL